LNKKGKNCLGLTGKMASGKGEIVNILTGRGYKYISLSDMVREAAASIGDEVSRVEMQNIGNRLRKEGGAGVLGRKVKEKIEASSIKKWVIDGIRNPAEVSELKTLEAFSLIAVDSKDGLIFNRLKIRKRTTDIADENELKKRLDREWGIGEPPDGQQVGKCVELADFFIKNNGTLKFLEDRVLEILNFTEEKNGY
jgi:dephospho-CoA kinase